MTRISAFAGLMLLASFLWGCGSKSETTSGSKVETTTVIVGTDSGKTNLPTTDKATPNGINAPTAGAAWTLDMNQAKPPEGPVSGRIHGIVFKPDKVEFEHGVLSLRQGKDFFADAEIRVFLFGDGQIIPEGKKFEVSPKDDFGTYQISMQYKIPSQELPASEAFFDKYLLKLEFGKLKDDQLPGKIYLCLPDAAKSVVAGSFQAHIKADPSAKPGPKQVPFIAGKIDIKGKAKEKRLVSAGYSGQTIAGKWEGNNAGYPIELGSEAGGSATSTTFDPRNTHFQFEPMQGGAYSHVKLNPGRYLVYAKADHVFFDWKWIEVKPDSQINLDFTLDFAQAGDLELTLPASSVTDGVDIVPLDGDGKLPFEGNWNQVSTSLGTHVRPQEPKMVMTGLRAGKYRVLAGKATADVEVKAGMTVKSELKLP